MTPPPAAAVAETLPRTRRPSRRTPAPRPRRVSGPAAPARRSAPARRTAAAGTAAAGGTSVRVASGRPASGRTAAARPANPPGLALRAFAVYERVADSQLLDRLARGRLWIGLLAFALIGIVAMQLMVLKLNTGIGATLAREAALQRDNAQLGIQSSTGSGEARIEPLAAATGMTFAPPGSVHFVTSNPATDVSRAAQALAAPIPPHEASASSYENGGEASGGSSEATPSEASSGEASAGGGEASAASASGSAGSAAATEASTGQSAGSAEATGGSSGSSTASSAPAAEASSAPATGGATGAAGGVAAGHE